MKYAQPAKHVHLSLSIYYYGRRIDFCGYLNVRIVRIITIEFDFVLLKSSYFPQLFHLSVLVDCVILLSPQRVLKSVLKVASATPPLKLTNNGQHLGVRLVESSLKLLLTLLYGFAMLFGKYVFSSTASQLSCRPWPRERFKHPNSLLLHPETCVPISFPRLQLVPAAFNLSGSSGFQWRMVYSHFCLHRTKLEPTNRVHLSGASELVAGVVHHSLQMAILPRLSLHSIKVVFFILDLF